MMQTMWQWNSATDSDMLWLFRYHFPLVLAELFVGLYLCHRILGDDVLAAFKKTSQAHIDAAREDYIEGWLK
jgi:hypothetical protein